MFRVAEMQPHGQFDAGVDAALKRAEPGRPGRLRVRSLAARGLAVVLLAAFAALLALPLQAQAQNAGICGRTKEVRDAIVGLVSDVTHCAVVTDAHLAAITGTLSLSSKGITALAAGDFDGLTGVPYLDLQDNELAELPAGVFAGLTALTDLSLNSNGLTSLPTGVFDNLTSLQQLWLDNNDLTELPAGVFDNLTALTELRLYDNQLATLPANVFAGLISLTRLDLHSNELDTLPAGVFAGLTSLTTLNLRLNPGEPFAPTADALPDDGTVPDAGGTVTLDGSGSGGAWGTNVTYSWRQTSGPTSGVTFDDTAIATPEVTIPALTASTELTFTLTVNDGTSDLTLDPTFTSAKTSYAAEVANAVTTVRLTAMTTDDGASVSAVTLSGIAIADSDFTDGITVPSLLVGDNAIVVTVTVEDMSTQAYTVTVTRAANNAPTASDGSVTTDEDTAHTFAEDEFNFADSDGTEESALAYMMTVNVTAVDDPATGGPSIRGTAWVGGTLRVVTTDITDEDGLSGATYSYQWVRVDADGTSNATDVVGETADTYVPVEADVGKKVRVKVSFTDDGGGNEELTSDAYPSSGTIEAEAPGICERTRQVRVGILARIGNVSDCALVTDARLANITGTLELDGKSIDTLAAGDFAGLTALTTLDLGFNDLTTLPDDVFAGLTALTGLYLNSNKLRTLPDDVFAGLTALTGLYLNSNKLRTLDAGVFAGLTELQELDLSDNRLNTLDAGVFAGLPALETLRLESNDLVTLDAGVFAGLSALATLRLEYNELTTLDAGVFAGLSALATLRLEHNELATLPDDVFEPLTALTDLQLSDNSGASFAPVADALPDSGTVSHGGGTVTLDGSRSGGAWGTNVTYGWALTAPTSGVTVRFDDDASVTTLVTIEALAADIELTFTLTVTGRGGTDGITPGTDTAKVTVTRVAAAGICGRTPVVRDRILGKISGVSNCALVTDTHLADITGTLDLNGQNIAALAAGDFAGLTSLRVLSLNNNDLTTLADGVFDGLAGLETLNLSRNNLTTLADGVFDGLVALEILNLTNNVLTTLDAGVFDGLVALEILNLRHNQLQSLPDGVFEPLTALTGLDLRNNRSAPFAPTADAQPDDGTVSSAGGRVTLDGNGSDGGPWGMNVTYSWRQTSGPTSGVRLNDDASVTPEARIPALAAETVLTFTLTVTGRGGEDERGVAPAADTAKVTVLLDPTAGVCGRTPAVRDALIAELGVTLCGAVSDADLASITELTLSGQEFTALAAGDFAGLTSLETLRLTNTALTALPGGVFDGLNALTALLVNGNNTLTALSPGAFAGLTSLETLWLNNNALENLPDGVFAGLTSLKTLRLENNELATLPDDVFEPLTALTTLDLLDNDGAPFSPEAVARPDDGTVPVAGGMVTLDGSDSGGAWGTNVTYSWRQTSGPTSGVTFDDDTSATALVTIPALMAETELTFTLTVTGRGGTSGIDPATDSAKVTATASDDATLGALTVNDGTGDLTLDPTFAPGTFAYAAEVGKAVTTVTLTAMKTDDGASVSAVTLNGNAIADSDFTNGITVPSLLVGDNDIVVTVTAENGASQTYTVTVTRTNSAPTASDGSVTTDEDTAHTFAAVEFNFVDPDAGDALASVTVVTLPAAGGLALDGTAVTLDQAVPAAKIGDLVFTPEANANGMGYASFTFKVSDGTEESALAYMMTVNVTAVNDPATGMPTISGTARVGETLTAVTTGIADADGPASPTYGYQWIRVDADGTSNATDVVGETADTYIPVEADDGKKIRVKVSFTDDDSTDEELTSDAFPSSGTIEVSADICGRTGEVRRALLALISSVSNCADVTATHLAAIGTLDLSNRPNLTALAAGDFAGLTSLTDLWLYDNSLARLPARVFDGLTSLRVLNLFNNDLATLPAGVFDGLTELRTLRLFNNDLATLPDGVFAGLTELRTLRLEDNFLATLPDGVFAGLTSLTRLGLYANKLTTLPDGVFDGLTSLTTLGLYDNFLATLPDGVFAGLTALRTLNLSDNFLATLDAGVFDGLTALETL